MKIFFVGVVVLFSSFNLGKSRLFICCGCSTSVSHPLGCKRTAAATHPRRGPDLQRDNNQEHIWPKVFTIGLRHDPQLASRGESRTSGTEKVYCTQKVDLLYRHLRCVYSRSLFFVFFWCVYVFEVCVCGCVYGTVGPRVRPCGRRQ